MEWQLILEFLKNNWQWFVGSGGFVSIIGWYKKRKKTQLEYDKNIWHLIKPSNQIKRVDFNVPNIDNLKSRPSDLEIDEWFFEKKSNILLIGGTEDEYKYGKSTLLYSTLSSKKNKTKIIFQPNLSKRISSENEINIPNKWLKKKNREFVLLVENLHKYESNMDSLREYYDLLKKKSTELIVIVTSDYEREFDWRDSEINFVKIKLTPVEKLNENETSQLKNINEIHKKLSESSKNILFYLSFYEEIGINASKQNLFELHNQLNFKLSTIDFEDNLFSLEATGFIDWEEDSIFLKKCEINPDNTNYHYIKKSDNLFSVDLFENYLIKENDINGLLHLSELYLAQYNFDKSFSLLEISHSISPNNIRIKKKLADFWLLKYKHNINSKNDYNDYFLDESIKWFKSIIIDKPKHSSYKLNLAYAYIKRGMSQKNSKIQKTEFFNKAKEQIEDTKTSNNKNLSSINFSYAYLYKKLDKKDESLLYYEKLINDNYFIKDYNFLTEYSELLFEIAEEGLNTNYNDKIENNLTKAIGTQPDNFYKAHNIFANYFNWRSRNPKIDRAEQIKLRELSIEHYDKAFKKSNQNYVLALKGKSKVLISENRNDEAIKILKKIVEKNPFDIYSVKSLAYAYKNKNNYKKAIHYFINAIDISITLGYIKTRKNILDLRYEKLFKELLSLCAYNDFKEILNKEKKNAKNLLTKDFIKYELDYLEIQTLRNEIEQSSTIGVEILNRIDAIKNDKIKDFIQKTKSLYFVKKADLSNNITDKKELYEKAKLLLDQTYQERRKKPESYYKHTIVIYSKLSLIDDNYSVEQSIRKFESRILRADKRYAEIHFEFAKFLENLFKKDYNKEKNRFKKLSIEQYKEALEKFRLNKKNFREIEYCTKRINEL